MTRTRRIGARVGTLVLAGAGVLSPAVDLRAQSTEDLVARVAAADAALDRIPEGELWPGFRPDTIPIVYAFPDRGWALANWTDDTLPAGFEPAGVAGVAWRPVVADAAPGANMVALGERGWAFVPTGSLSEAGLIGLAAHEAFHVWQSAARRAGTYRRGENSALVIDYPEFDPAAEAGFALEGRLLAAALAAGDPGARRDRAWEFVAARESRHRGIGPELQAFEENAELNEGVAQYVYLRAVERAAANGDLSVESAEAEVRGEVGRLEGDLVAEGRQSLRRRFYTTGSALGRLLDRVAGSDWKTDLVERRLSLHGLLAHEVGYRAREDSLVAAAGRHAEGLEALVERSIDERRSVRQARADSALSGDGLRIVLESPSLGLCGFDPQNLLRLADGRLLHARWIRFCLPDGSAEFETPVVQDRDAGIAIAVLARPDQIEIAIGGERVSLEALPEGEVEGLSIVGSGLRLQAAGARLSHRNGALVVTVEP